MVGYYHKECTKCKACESSCPTGAIKFNCRPIIKNSDCILCFHCLRNPSNNALYFKLLTKVKYFKGPKTINGYIHPNDLLKKYQNKVIN